MQEIAQDTAVAACDTSILSHTMRGYWEFINKHNNRIQNGIISSSNWVNNAITSIEALTLLALANFVY